MKTTIHRFYWSLVSSYFYTFIHESYSAAIRTSFAKSELHLPNQNFICWIRTWFAKSFHYLPSSLLHQPKSELQILDIFQMKLFHYRSLKLIANARLDLFYNIFETVLVLFLKLAFHFVLLFFKWRTLFEIIFVSLKLNLKTLN